MTTHTVRLQEMTEIVSRMESNQYISGLPLAVMAKDTETLKYLHSNGIDINPRKSERKGHEAVIVYAAKKLDKEMVTFCKGFPVSSEDIKEAIFAAVNSGIKRAISPFEIVEILQEGRSRDEMRFLSTGVTGLFVAAPEYYARKKPDISISKVRKTLSGLIKTIELLMSGKSD